MGCSIDPIEGQGTQSCSVDFLWTMIQRVLPFLGLIFLGTSCNVARMHVRHCEKQLVKDGYAARTMHSEAGKHYAWYRDSGREKLLLLHGYSGTGALQWHRTAHLLRDRYDCVLPDLLSHGNSSTWDTTRSGKSMDDQVAHVILILDSLGIKGSVALVGNSYGGGVAARLAELYPQRVKRLVIYDGLVSDYSAAIADSIAKSIGSSGMIAIMSTPNVQELRHAIRLSIYRNPPLPGFLLKTIHRELVQPYRAAQITLIGDLLAHEDQFLHKRFEWPMPVYLLWGERDELIPNATGLAIMQRNALPDSHWHTIPRTGHVPNLERPKAFDRTLRTILDAR